MKKLILFTTFFVSLFFITGCQNQNKDNGQFETTKELSGYYITGYEDKMFLYKENDYYLFGYFLKENADFYKTQSNQENKVGVLQVFNDQKLDIQENYSPIYENINEDHEYYSVTPKEDFTLSDKSCSLFKYEDSIYYYIVKVQNDKLIFFPGQESGMPYACVEKDVNFTKESGIIYNYNSSTESFEEVNYFGTIILDEVTYYCINFNSL